MTIATEAQVEVALRNNLGIKSKAAAEVGITRQSMQERIDTSPHLQQVLREIDEEVLDLAEGTIFTALKEGDRQTARWAAERKGAKRGWGNRVETTIKLGDPELEAFASALGGDLDKLRAAREALSPENPTPSGQS